MEKGVIDRRADRKRVAEALRQDCIAAWRGSPEEMNSLLEDHYTHQTYSGGKRIGRTGFVTRLAAYTFIPMALFAAGAYAAASWAFNATEGSREGYARKVHQYAYEVKFATPNPDLGIRPVDLSWGLEASGLFGGGLGFLVGFKRLRKRDQLETIRKAADANRKAIQTGTADRGFDLSQ